MEIASDSVEHAAEGMPFARRVWLSVIVATLMAGGYLGQILSVENRLYMFFNWQDTFLVLALIAGFGLIAAILLHAGACITKGRSDKWLSPWFYFLAVLILFNLKMLPRERLVEYFPGLTAHAYYLMIWGVGLAATLGGYFIPKMNKWALAGWRGLAIFWPLLLIMPLSLALAPKWEKVSGDPNRLGACQTGRGAPVVILILDMIGYDDAFTAEGTVRKAVPNLAAFAGSSMVFHRARSGGYETASSLPGLILQEEVGFPILQKGGARWKTRLHPQDPARTAKEFEMALPYRFRNAGGRAVYIGSVLPYKNLMPGAWDEVFTLSISGVELSWTDSIWATRFLRHVIQFVGISKDPVSGIMKQLGVPSRMYDRYWRKITKDLLGVSRRYVRQCLSPGDMVIIHLNIPHSPYVFDTRGNPVSLPANDQTGYLGQLQYADHLFGTLLDDMKQAGQFDGSWIVMLSDHGSHWRDWSQNPEEKRHVPLMVKAPGQVERRDMDKAIRLADFKQIPGFP